MHFHYSFLLLLVVLSVYSESLQHAKAPDSFNSTVVTVHPSSSTIPLGILAPVLPQNEVFKIVLPQNEVSKITLPQNEVLKITLPWHEVLKTILPSNEVLKIVLPQNEVIPVQIKCFESENLFKRAQNIISKLKLVMTQSVKSFRKLMSPVVHGGNAFLWAIRIAPECFQNVLKMYGWSLAENQVSIRFRCRLTALYLKRSFFSKA
jgi:hypothetical protein